MANNQSVTNSSQIPEKSILDAFDRQTYLAQQFVYATGSTSIAGTSETALIALSNPTGTKQAIFQNFKKLTCLTSGQTAVLNFYLNPTLSAPGTTQTPLNLRPAEGHTSVMTLASSPTASANGTLISSLSSAAFAPDKSDVLLILDAGQSLLVTVTVSQAATKISAELGWYEL